MSLNIIKILEAKNASPFIKLCQNNKNIGVLLFEIFNFFRGSPESILSILKILLKHQFKDTIAKKHAKNNNLLQIGDIVLLFGGVSLSKLIDQIDHSQIKDSDSLNQFIGAIRTEYPDTDIGSLEKLNEDITQLLPCLLEAGFFDNIAKVLFSGELYIDNKFNPQSVVGIMLGTVLHNKDLIRS